MCLLVGCVWISYVLVVVDWLLVSLLVSLCCAVLGLLGCRAWFCDSVCCGWLICLLLAV